MNRHLRRTRLVTGVGTTNPSKADLPPCDEHAPQAEHVSRASLPPAAARIEDCAHIRIDEPMRFNWVRYERLMRTLHGKITLAAVLVTTVVLLMLGWRAENGEPISPERWLCGAGSGWFITWMVRLALFTFLAAPRFVRFMPGGIHLSGLGALRPDQILHWKLHREVTSDSGERAGARLEIGCRWLWWERRWTMFLNDATQADLLHHLLKTRLAPKSMILRRTWATQLRLKPES